MRIAGFSPAEMERSSGFRMGLADDDDEWGGGLVVVAVVVVKDLEMGVVGNRKKRRVGVVVVLSSILKGFSFFSRRLRGTRNDERPLPACLLASR